ncbi:ATP-dependent RNA helicase DHX8 [Cryptosporidium andersoni]|uniref:RNA helicase n=1 Tax=Cryptosporidium andersoni TaxID=117008 RepID=A0A1J4MU85_9CRYT|nr:ATP-dependent RNA helicase DHX8 [Cryptosporidium andersoni]
MSKRTEDLPIFQHKYQIISTIKENDVVIITGETGSGKTTQIPIFLHESGFTNNRKTIAITQPRRIAAISLAKHVSALLNSKIGHIVGYSVRFRSAVSYNTRIKFLTDGMLIRECITRNTTFDNYSVVIIDEAHERSIRTDFLLGILHNALLVNKKVKIIIMSATFQYEDFVNFFNKQSSDTKNFKIKCYNIPGRQYPVKIYYLPEPEIDYIDATLITILTIHFTKPKGDILVFLPGQDDILHLYDTLTEKSDQINEFLKLNEHVDVYIGSQQSKTPQILRMYIQCLYSAMTSEEQSRVFDKIPDNHRKIILATNIAETSVTLPNITYVIDSGLEKQKYHFAETGLDALVVQEISKTAAIQRAGRAGRVKPGEVYRMYTVEGYKQMKISPIPDILRTSLSETILELLSILELNFEDADREKPSITGLNYNIANKIFNFPFVSPPRKESIMMSLQYLYRLGALDRSGAINELGYKLAILPLPPILGKLLYDSISLYCTSEILSLIAMLSSECHIEFNINSTKKSTKNKNSKKYSSNIKIVMSLYGDHIGLIELYNQWISKGNINVSGDFHKSGFNKFAYNLTKDQKSLCNDLGISNTSLIRAYYIRSQLADLVRSVFGVNSISSCLITKNINDHESNVESDIWLPVLKCITKGLWMQSARLDNSGKQYITELNKQTVSIHPSSSVQFMKNKPQWVIFSELIYTRKMYIRCISPINAKWLSELCPNWFVNTNT